MQLSNLNISLGLFLLASNSVSALPLNTPKPDFPVPTNTGHAASPSSFDLDAPSTTGQVPLSPEDQGLAPSDLFTGLLFEQVTKASEGNDKLLSFGGSFHRLRTGHGPVVHHTRDLKNDALSEMNYLSNGPEASVGFKASTGLSLASDIPAGSAFNYGAPAGSAFNYGAPVASDFNYGAPVASDFDYGASVASDLASGTPTASNLIAQVSAEAAKLNSSSVPDALAALKKLTPQESASLQQYFQSKHLDGMSYPSNDAVNADTTDGVQNKNIFSSIFRVGAKVFGKIFKPSKASGSGKQATKLVDKTGNDNAGTTTAPVPPAGSSAHAYAYIDPAGIET